MMAQQTIVEIYVMKLKRQMKELRLFISKTEDRFLA